jgi:hypothetical protein
MSAASEAAASTQLTMDTYKRAVWALEGSGGLKAAKFTVPKNRIIQSNLTNTVIYAINTIRRIIRLRRMTYPCI